MNSVAAVSEAKGSRWTKVWTGLLLLLGGVLLNQVPWYHSIGAWPDLLIPIGAFFIAATGVIFCLIGLARIVREREFVRHGSTTLGISPFSAEQTTPTKSGRRRRFSFPVSILPVPLTVLFGLFYLGTQFTQTGADRTGQCQGLIQVFAGTGLVPQSAALAGRPAVGCGSERYGMFLTLYNSVSIRGIADHEKQDQLLRKLSNYQKQNHILPMRVFFYDKENWIEHSGKNGVAWGQRGREKLIRVATLH